MSLSIAVISYHKNADKIYPPHWIDEYRHSIENQTYKPFDLYETEYGGGEFRIFKNSYYESNPFPTFVDTLNYMLDELFETGYDCVFNTNCDDVYSLDRIEKQLPYIKMGYDLVTSNFSLIEDDKIVHEHKFDKMDIRRELGQNHNIVAHPAVVYSKKFWEKNRYVPDQIPFEDLMLWQRGIQNSKFIILPDNLLFHRVHNQSVCQSENR